jgi:hypothetical protein
LANRTVRLIAVSDRGGVVLPAHRGSAHAGEKNFRLCTDLVICM